MLSLISTRCQFALVLCIMVLGLELIPFDDPSAQPAPGEDVAILHVDADPTNSSVNPAGLGDTWGVGHAFRFLQDAISQANFLLAQEESPDWVEIWIADGIYRPDQHAGTAQTEAGTGDEEATFEMARKVRWYGGFAGTETALNARNPSANVSILSGAINGDTAYHIVTAIRVDATARMDGFTITGGNAAGAPAPESADQGEGGVGMLIYGDGSDNSTAASPVVLRCIFTSNLAKYGAGVWFRGSENSHPWFYNCRFIQNTATQDGGGFYANDQIAVAPGVGGTPKFANCIFDLNTATNGGGGGLFSESGCIVTITNCTITRNTAANASAILHSGACDDIGGWIDMSNSIVYFNNGSDHVEGSATITYSCLTDLAWCNCQCPTSPPGAPFNINADPLFINLSAGDYRLACGSPCLNKGKNEQVPNDDFDIDQDGIGQSSSEPLPEFDLRDSIVGAQSPATVDMGAFERAVAPNEICNGEADGIVSSLGVNIDDLVCVVVHWGPCPGSMIGCQGDIYPVPCGNGVVDIDDLNVVINTWCCGATESCQSAPVAIWDCFNSCLDTRGDFGECVIKCMEAMNIYNP